MTVHSRKGNVRVTWLCPRSGPLIWLRNSYLVLALELRGESESQVLLKPQAAQSRYSEEVFSRKLIKHLLCLVPCVVLSLLCKFGADRVSCSSGSTSREWAACAQTRYPKPPIEEQGFAIPLKNSCLKPDPLKNSNWQCLPPEEIRVYPWRISFLRSIPEESQFKFLSHEDFHCKLTLLLRNSRANISLPLKNPKDLDRGSTDVNGITHCEHCPPRRISLRKALWSVVPRSLATLPNPRSWPAVGAPGPLSCPVWWISKSCSDDWPSCYWPCSVETEVGISCVLPYRRTQSWNTRSTRPDASARS